MLLDKIIKINLEVILNDMMLNILIAYSLKCVLLKIISNGIMDISMFMDISVGFSILFFEMHFIENNFKWYNEYFYVLQ